MSDASGRFVALDVHKSYLVVGAVDAAQTVVLSPRKVDARRFDEWARQHLRPTDIVVFEVTTNAWALYDLLTPLVAQVVVANPAQVEVIAHSLVKTDTRDTLALARLLAAHLIPQVWVPPQEVRELRALIAHRQRLVSQRSAAKNRLQSLLHRHHYLAPQGELFTRLQRPWWEGLELASAERLRAQQDLSTIDHLTSLIAEVEEELGRLSNRAPRPRADAFPPATAWRWAHHSHDHPGCYWRDQPLRQCQSPGWIQRAGSAGPCVRTGASDRWQNLRRDGRNCVSC